MEQESVTISLNKYNRLVDDSNLLHDLKKKGSIVVFDFPSMCDPRLRVMSRSQFAVELKKEFDVVLKLASDLREAKDKEILQLKTDIKTMAGKIAEQQRILAQPKKRAWEIWK